MNWFVLSAIFILGIVFVFLGFSLTGIGAFSWYVAASLIGLILVYPLVWYDVLPYAWDQLVRALAHGAMGLVSLLLAFLVVRAIVFIPLMVVKTDLASFAFSTPVTIGMLAVAVVLLGVGHWKARRGPEIRTVQVPVDGLPDGLNHYTILQISDLHAGAGIPRQYVEQVVEKTLNQPVDCIVLTGDIADGDFRKYQHRVEPISRLTGRAPVLYCSGNHEYLRDSEQWFSYFRELGIQVLLNQYTIVSKKDHSILFAGVIDRAARDIDPLAGPMIAKSVAGSPPVDLRILLAHRPELAKAAEGHFDLQLSGHIHAGQFFPWSSLIRLFQPFAVGLKKWGSLWVYTNAGTGFWGPPFRLGTTSEITLIKIVPK